MDKLARAVARLATDFSVERALGLADELARSDSRRPLDVARDSATPGVVDKRLRALARELKRFPDLTRRELELALRAALAAVQERERRAGEVELAWTGPKTTSVPLRRTEQALCNLIDGARKTLFVVSYVVYSADSVVAALLRAAERDVKIGFLLEPSKSNGGKIQGDSIAPLRLKFPTADFYAWKHEKGASIHAKCALADDAAVFISSANLTDYAMNRNVELGVLITGGLQPRRAKEHFDALIREGKIVKT